MPSDHYENNKKFVNTLEHAIDLASKNFWLQLDKTKEPISNFGYILPIKKNTFNYFEIDEFIEKPSKNKAEKLIKEIAFGIQES